MTVIHEAPIPSEDYVRCGSCLVTFDKTTAPRKMSVVNVDDEAVYLYCPVCNFPHLEVIR